jgi:hypothetical protein
MSLPIDWIPKPMSLSPDRPFQSSLLFGSKGGAYLSGAPFRLQKSAIFIGSHRRMISVAAL